jgi:hypothetical protein
VLAYDIRGFLPGGDVPTLPILLPEALVETGEQRISAVMALNVDGLTDALVESARELVTLLEQRLDQTKGELATVNKELAETKEKLAAQDEQI